MSLLVLMLHRARAGREREPGAALEALLALVARSFNCVLPGEPLDRRRLNVCLTFDDAYYDVFTLLPPLLERHDLRAVMAVPTGLIRESANTPAAERLEVPLAEALALPESGGLCTWPELESLAATGRFAFAAHGHTHVRLRRRSADIDREVVEPRRLLERCLSARVESFVYPIGHFDREVHALVRRHYRYAFRIGQASNAGWDAPVLYRVDAERMAPPERYFSPLNRLRFRRNALWNRLRGR